MRTRIILWRHGNTDWNHERRIQGQTDIALNERGRSQAAAAAVRLAELKPDLLISSDLSRALHTAETLVELTGLAVERDARLRERNFGSWETHTMTEVSELFPDSHTRYMAGDTAPGDGVEPRTDLGKRVAEVIRTAADRKPGGLVVLATHGGAAKWGVASLLGWSDEVTDTLEVLRNCRWTEVYLDTDRGWQLAAHNMGV